MRHRQGFRAVPGMKGKLQLGAHQNAGELVFEMKSFDADTPANR
jgi:hypothetical protein